jgi:hypothetical protein
VQAGVSNPKNLKIQPLASCARNGTEVENRIFQDCEDNPAGHDRAGLSFVLTEERGKNH